MCQSRSSVLIGCCTPQLGGLPVGEDLLEHVAGAPEAGNWKRAIETADVALQLNKKNYKAAFRKARALKEQGYFEKAEKILQELINDGDPNGASDVRFLSVGALY